MKVFISWSGPTSKHIATALRNWLPEVIQAVEPWMSQHDIGAGARWSETLDAELENTDFGIICLAPGNLDKPWLMYEAGALSKKVKDSCIVPLIYKLPVTAAVGPLKKFQGVVVDEEGIWKLVRAINDALGDSGLPPDRLNSSLKRLLPELIEQLRSTPEPTEEDIIEATPSQEVMLEEILQTVRQLQRNDPRILGYTRSSKPPSYYYSWRVFKVIVIAEDENSIRRFEKELWEEDSSASVGIIGQDASGLTSLQVNFERPTIHEWVEYKAESAGLKVVEVEGIGVPAKEIVYDPFEKFRRLSTENE